MPAIDPALHTAATAALETAVNRALALDPIGSQALQKLQGKVFQFSCTAPELDVFLMPEAGRIRLMGYWDGDVTTAIRGSGSDFAELAASEDPASALINGALELRGDSAPLLELQRILAGLDMDWEAPLVNVFGDIAGHQIAESLRGVLGWGLQARASLTRQLGEFIHEEARLSPPRQEVEDFYTDLEQLNHRVDRLQARLRRLAGRLRETSG